MKILLTTHQFFPQYTAGTEVLTLSVAKELVARGHEVEVLTGYPGHLDMPDEDRCDQYDFEGIRVYRFHHAYVPMGEQTSMVEIAYDNRVAARYFERILQSFTPDVVHFFHLSRLGTGLVDVAVRAGVPSFMTPTDFWAICPTTQLVFDNGKLCSGPDIYAGNCVKHLALSTQKGLVGNVIKWLPAFSINLLVRLTQAEIMPQYPQQIEVKAIATRLPTNIRRLNQLKKIVSPNNFMTEKLIQYGVLSNLIVQSAYGIDIPEIEVKKSRQLPHQPFRVGFIGTLAQHKGCHLLIEAFKELPVGQAELRVYGSTEDFPDYSSNLKTLAEDRENIIFCGTFHNSKIAEVLADLDVLVVPSLWYENTPLVIYSAQAANCPVIASNFPSISEVVCNQVNGLLFEAGNVNALAKQLKLLVTQPDFVAKLSANCKQPKSTAAHVDELLNIWTAN